MNQTRLPTAALLKCLEDYRAAYRLLLREHLQALSILAIEAETNYDAKELLHESCFYPTPQIPA